MIGTTVALTLMFCLGSSAQNITNSTTLPDLINVTITNLFPEGIEWNGLINKFLLSSGTFGTVYSVDDLGGSNGFVNDSRLIGSFGIELDTRRELLYIANTNRSALSRQGGSYSAGKVQGSLIVANARTGSVVSETDLTSLAKNSDPSSMFINDLTADPATGDVYTTDTTAGRIYKIDATTKTASIYADVPEFAPTSTALSVNGIKYHNGYLLTCVPARNGTIYKVSIGMSSPTVSAVSGATAPGCDGIRVSGSGNLIISNRTNVLEISSLDDYTTGSIVQVGENRFKLVSTNALRPIQNTNLQAVYVTNPFVPTTGPFIIERSISVQDASPSSSPTASPSVSYSYSLSASRTPSPTPTPSPSSTATPSPTGNARRSKTQINFYFADMLNGIY